MGRNTIYHDGVFFWKYAQINGTLTDREIHENFTDLILVLHECQQII